MKDIMADYVKLPELEEYREWFKDHFDLYREDGILQVTWKTLDGPMHHSGMLERRQSSRHESAQPHYLPGSQERNSDLDSQGRQLDDGQGSSRLEHLRQRAL